MNMKLSKLILTSVILSASLVASAQTSWTGSTSTAWNTATNWSLGAVPTSATNVLLVAPTAPNSTITVATTDAQANELNVLDDGYTISIGSANLSATVINLPLNILESFSLASTSGDISVASEIFSANGSGTFETATGTIDLPKIYFLNSASDGRIYATVTGSGTININNIIDTTYGNVTLTGGTIGSSINLVNASSTLGNATVILNNADLNFNNGSLNAQSSGVISGVGTVTMTDGHATLSGNNSYSGGTILNGGVLIAGIDSGPSTGAFGTGSITFNGAGFASVATANTTLRSIYNDIVLNIASSGSNGLIIDSTNGNISLNGSISSTATAPLIFDGAHNITLAGVNSYTGQTQIRGETTVVIANSSSLGLSSNVTFSGNGTLLTTLPGGYALSRPLVITAPYIATLSTSGGNITSSGIISGSGVLNAIGGNTLALQGNNTYSGGTNISGATQLIASHVNALGDSTANSSSSIITFSGNGTIGTTLATYTFLNNVDILGGNFATLDSSGGNLNIPTVIYGPGNLILDGDNTITISGTNTYSGSTSILGNTTIIASGPSPFGNSSIININGNSTLTENSTYTLPGIVNIASGVHLTVNGTGNLSFANLSNSIQGAGNLTYNGTGSMTIQNSTTLSGDLLVTSGTLYLSNLGSLPNIQSFTLDAPGILDITGAIGTPKIKNFSGSGNVTLGSNNLQIIESGNFISNIYSGVMSGAGGLIVGDGTSMQGLTLTAAQTYLGNTTVLSGTLYLAQNGSIATSSSLFLDGKGSFDISQISASSTEVNQAYGSGTIYLGSKELILNITGSTTLFGDISGSGGDLTLQGGGILTLAGNNSFSGSLNILDSSTLIAANLNGFGDAGLTISFLGNGTIGTTLANGYLFLNDIYIDPNQVATLDSTGGNLDVPTIIYGSGSLALTGGNQITLRGNNSYTGGTSLTGSTSVIVGSASAFGASLNPITFTGNGSIETSMASGYTFLNNLSIQNGFTATLNSFGGNLIVTTNITGAGNLYLTGGRTILLDGSNSYSGKTTLDDSTTVTLGSSLALGSTSMIEVNGDATINAKLGLLSYAFPSVINIATPSTLVLDTTYANMSFLNSANALSGSGNLVKNGAGTLTLSKSSNLSGAVTINEGTLYLTDLGSLPNVLSLTLNSLASYAFDISGVTSSAVTRNVSGMGNINLGSNELTLIQTMGPTFAPLSGVISGSGGSLIVGDGSSNGDLILAGVNSYSGSTRVKSGSLYLQGSGSIASSSSLTLDALSWFDISTINSSTLVNELSGAGSINLGAKNLGIHITSSKVFSGDILGVGGSISIQGGGSLTLSGNGSSYSGDTNISGATSVIAGSRAAFGSQQGSINFLGNGVIQTSLSSGYTFINPIAISSNATATFDASTGSLNLATNISGLGSVELQGINPIVMSGNNSYLGNTTFNSNNLHVIAGSNSAFGASSSSVQLNGNTYLSTTSLRSLENNFNLNEYFLSVDTGYGNIRFNGVLSGSPTPTSNASLIKTGANTLLLGGLNSYSGATLVQEGTLALVGSGSISNSSSVTLNSGSTYALDISAITSASSLVNDISGSGHIYLGGKNLNITLSAARVLSGNIDGSFGSLTLLGTGSLTLLGANSYSSGTNLNSNVTVVAGSNSAFGSGTVTFNNQATIGTSSTSLRTLMNDINVNGYSATFDTSLGNMQLNGVVYGVGSISKTGNNQLILSQKELFSGSWSINQGGLTLTGQGDISAGTALTLGALVNLDISSIVASSTQINNLSGGSIINLGSKNLIINTTGANEITASLQGVGGSLTLQGSGSLKLTGNSNYTGATNLLGGITVIASNINAFGSSSSPINFSGNGTIQSDLLGGYTFINDIQISAGQVATLDASLGNLMVDTHIIGLGNLELMGPGSVEIGGYNTYYGSTYLGNNVVAVAGNTQAFGQKTSEIRLRGDATISSNLLTAYTFVNNIDLNANTLTLDSSSSDLNLITTVKGSGQLEFTGSGTTYVNNQNNFSGGSILSGNGRLELGASSTQSYLGVASGPLGQGTLTVSGDGTITADGSYIMGNALNASSDFTFDIQPATSLNWIGSINPTLANLTITKTDIGELVLSGINFTQPNSTSAILHANGGTLTLNSVYGLGSYALFPDIELSGQAILKVNQNVQIGLGFNLYNQVDLLGNATFAPQLPTTVFGNWFFDNNGTVLTLSTSKAIFTSGIYSNADASLMSIEVENGAEFTSNRSVTDRLPIESNMQVLAGGRVSGNLNISNNLDVRGIVAPGNSIGTIVVGGNYTQSGTYICELNRQGQSDLIDITGSANLSAGTLSLIKDASDLSATGYYIHNSYTILKAQGTLLSTQFASIDQGQINAFEVDVVNGSLIYTPTAVKVNLGQGLLSSAKNSNQTFIYETLINLDPPNEAQQQIIDALIESRNAPLLAAAFSGEQASNVMLASSATSMHFVNAIYNPLRKYLADPCKMCSCDNESYFEVAGIGGNYDNDHQSYGFSSAGSDLIAGMQTHINSNVLFGSALFYEYNHLSFKESGNANRNTLMGSLYGLYRSKCAYFLLDLNGGYNWGDISRNPLGFKAHGNINATMLGVYSELGFDLYSCNSCFTLQPFVAINANYTSWNSLKERGDESVIISSLERSYVEAITRLGLHLYSESYFNTLVGLDLDWAYRTTNLFDHRTIEFNGAFDEVYGINLSRNSMEAALFLSKDFTNCLNLYIEGSTRVWSRAVEGAIVGGLTYRW